MMPGEPRGVGGLAARRGGGEAGYAFAVLGIVRECDS